SSVSFNAITNRSMNTPYRPRPVNNGTLCSAINGLAAIAMGPISGSAPAPSLKKICATALINVQKKTSPIACCRVNFLSRGLAKDGVAFSKQLFLRYPTIRQAEFGTIGVVDKERTTVTAETEGP